MAEKTFKCAKCDRTFSMAAHLARHQLSHASKKKNTAKKKAVGRPRKKGAVAGANRRTMTVAKRGPGRPRKAKGKGGNPFLHMTVDKLVEAKQHLDEAWESVKHFFSRANDGLPAKQIL